MSSRTRKEKIKKGLIPKGRKQIHKTGRTIEGVDTFYGWRLEREPRRGLDYLMKQAFGDES